MMKGVVVLLCFLTVMVELRKAPSNSSFTNLNETRYRHYNPDDQTFCTLPPHPKHGRWMVVNGEGREGETITVNTILKFHCKKGYKLSSSPYRVCDKKWSLKRFPRCLKLCPPMQSTPTITLRCVNKRGREIGCDEATEESYLTYTCAPFYETPFGFRTTFFCSDGHWNFAKPICLPVCGKKAYDDPVPLIYGGKMQQVMEYPWIAVIYKKERGEYRNICGGSIISQKLVLTAAHCVTNAYGDTLPVENYLVAAGKLHSNYNDNRDSHAQYLNIFHIVVHPTYRGESRRFLGDIAIIVTRQQFVLNKFIQPICFSDVINIDLQVGDIGVVAGFGNKEGGELSEDLRTLEIPYKSEANCARELPGDWGDRYNVIDKLCAGHSNKSMSICKGDSGNGLFFRNPENNRYYVHGVVSLGHARRGECDIQQNSLYTKVAFHYDFIDREITKYYVRDCSLPPYPENGIWISDIGDKKPGDSVPSDTLLRISCDESYQLSSDISYIKCEASFDMPTCQKLCPEVHYQVIEYNCTSKEGEVISCNEATDYTILTFECPPHYKILDGSKHTRQCLNGAWELPAPACQPIKSTIEEDIEEDTYTKIICVYDGKQYDNGVRLEDLDATLCTHIIYDSVGLSHDGNLRIKRSISDNDNYLSVAHMKAKNTQLRVLLTVYGLGDESTYEYPTMAADPVKRSAFVASTTNFLEIYNYDGINIHWNSVRMGDKENYVSLIREMKEAFERRGWLLSATVYYTTFYMGYELSEMYKFLDWINLATYNFYTEWTEYTGQNSALYSSSVETDYEKNNFNFPGVLRNWHKDGFELNKMSPTIAFFGRYYTLKNPKNRRVHAPVIGITDSNHTGLINYSEICAKYHNWTRVWDDEQKNPYKYFKNKWIGYDDEESVKLKAAYIKKKRFFGATVYPVNGDDIFGKCGPQQILLRNVYAELIDLEDVER